MRRKICVLAVTIAMIIALELTLTGYTRAAMEGYIALVGEIGGMIRLEDLEGAAERLPSIIRGWEETRAVVEIWISHDEAEEVARHLRDLNTYLNLRAVDDSLEILESLISALEHIRHKNRLTLANLL